MTIDKVCDLIKVDGASYLEKSCKNLSNLSEENKFIWLITSEDTDIIENLENHILLVSI